MISTTASLPRRRPRIVGFVAATALIVAGSYGLAFVRPPAVRPAPTAPTTTVDAAPVALPGEAPVNGRGTSIGSLRQIDHSIEAWSKNLAANPRDFLAATNLATLYHGRGRLSYDLTDLQRALAAARTALGIEPTHAPARALEAAILFTLHDFAAAFAAADELVRDDPSQLASLATRFDAELELGRIDDARADLDRLTATGGGPAVLIRAARLASVTGDPAAALDKARTARRSALADDVEDIGFYDFAVGEYARLAGDPRAARTAFQGALDARAGDIAALVGLARIDAFDGGIDAAIAGLTRAADIAPQPETLALLGDLQTRAGDPAASDAYDTVRFIERLGDIQTTTFDRQLVRFELDHGGATETVLARARASLTVRPDGTGHDTVAWALYRLGRFDEAAAEIAAARALGADDARLRFHDGAIAVARGDRVTGLGLLRGALDAGPALDPIERAEVQRLLGRP